MSLSILQNAIDASVLSVSVSREMYKSLFDGVATEVPERSIAAYISGVPIFVNQLIPFGSVLFTYKNGRTEIYKLS